MTCLQWGLALTGPHRSERHNNKLWNTDNVYIRMQWHLFIYQDIIVRSFDASFSCEPWINWNMLHWYLISKTLFSFSWHKQKKDGDTIYIRLILKHRTAIQSGKLHKPLDKKPFGFHQKVSRGGPCKYLDFTTEGWDSEWIVWDIWILVRWEGLANGERDPGQIVIVMVMVLIEEMVMGMVEIESVSMEMLNHEPISGSTRIFAVRIKRPLNLCISNIPKVHSLVFARCSSQVLSIVILCFHTGIGIHPMFYFLPSLPSLLVVTCLNWTIKHLYIKLCSICCPRAENLDKLVQNPAQPTIPPFAPKTSAFPTQLCLWHLVSIIRCFYSLEFANPIQSD